MRLAAQAQALAAQQMASQQHIQAMQSGHGHHGGAGSGHGGQKRKRHDEEESADTGEEGAEGEDMTPYCFCHRPSFGEVGFLLFSFLSLVRSLTLPFFLTRALTRFRRIR